MVSDEIIKKAEEYALKSGWSCIEEQLAGAEAFAIKQTYIDAYTQGRADAWKSLVMKYHLVDFVYYCKLQEQQFERQETATKYAEEYMKEYVKLPGGEND